MPDDPREAAARYRQEMWQREHAVDGEDADASAGSANAASTTAGSATAGRANEAARAYSAADRAAVVETAIQQAIRRGEFDDLPGAGKPIPGLGDHHDPDWWIRRKIETEQLTGLGPPALTLRVEYAEFEARIDDLRSEAEVREAVDDFNRRVIEARRQLQGGPPVVTPTRDAAAEVAAWHERRAARAEASRTIVEGEGPRRPWWRRGRG